MEKNSEYKGTVLSLGTGGEGIIKYGEERAFVPFCLPGEEISFRALKISGGAVYGKLSEVHTLSPHRALPKCPHFEKCGGCQLQHMDYSAQLAFKRENVANCLKKLGNIDFEVGETVPSPKEYGYRNKLALPVGVDAHGETAVGFYAPRSHRIVPINSCALQPDWSDVIISSLKEFIGESGFAGYDEKSRKGVIRHIVCREINGGLIVTLVAARRENISRFGEILSSRLKKFTLWLNVNASSGNVIFGDEWHIVRGQGYFSGRTEGIKFKAGANTFLQVNDGVREKLYSAVLDACADKQCAAIDLYSGGGLLTAMLAKRCAVAYGVEIIPEAVACADGLKEENGLEGKMINLCGRVEDRIGEVLSSTRGMRRVIVCDPPRKGMDRGVVKAVAQSGAEKVVLVSCDPATLARDISLLCGSMTDEGGKLVKNPAFALGRCGPYEILSVTPYDMFPQTRHVETLVVLGRVDAGE